MMSDLFELIAGAPKPAPLDRPLRMLELFAGLGGGSSGFKARGHQVVTTDFDPQFNCDVTGDILDDDTVNALVALGPFDFVWASPPCEGFSVMNIGKNWYHDHTPKTDRAREAMSILHRTVELLEGGIFGRNAPWVIENPRAKMRKMPIMQDLDRSTVWYCRYGLTIAKPTDIWTSKGLLDYWTPRPECHNGNPDHQRATRGSKTGVQGIASSPERALVPYQLSEEICLAVEKMLLEQP